MARHAVGLAGTIIGAVSRDKIITGEHIQVGDVLVGLPSNGLHTNGYSLARKLLFEVAGYKPTQYVTAIITERGVLRAPYLESLREMVLVGAH